ncbi:MAG: hypothetical protein K2N28_03885 [Muribaculaceae bacterium]|nr:hypothetical protein [Muribaculaceae bacterium]
MGNIESIRQALCDVRKAHRIIYAYQKRMMDIVRFIGNKLDFPFVEGYKHFSNGAPKKISSGTWAWDYLYTYLYEYYLGTKVNPENNIEYALSIFQFSDTGFFESDKSVRTNLSTFVEEEAAESKFLFFLEIKPKECPWWWKTEVINKKEFATKNHTSTILKEGESIIVLYSVGIEKFIDEKSALEVLNEFCALCSNEGLIELTLH